MNRIDRARLDRANFPAIIEVETRFDDLDMQGHVNNAAVVVILQEARVKFNRSAGAAMFKGKLRYMVAALHVEYAAEIMHPEPIAVHMGLLAIGRTSFTVAQMIRQNGRSAAYAETVIVIADENGPLALPPELRAGFEKLLLV